MAERRAGGAVVGGSAALGSGTGHRAPGTGLQFGPQSPVPSTRSASRSQRLLKCRQTLAEQPTQLVVLLPQQGGKLLRRRDADPGSGCTGPSAARSSCLTAPGSSASVASVVDPAGHRPPIATTTGTGATGTPTSTRTASSAAAASSRTAELRDDRRDLRLDRRESCSFAAAGVARRGVRRAARVAELALHRVEPGLCLTQPDLQLAQSSGASCSAGATRRRSG